MQKQTEEAKKYHKKMQKVKNIKKDSKGKGSQKKGGMGFKGRANKSIKNTKKPHVKK